MGYWYSRFLFERALAAMYLVGFAVAANQFVPLLGLTNETTPPKPVGAPVSNWPKTSTEPPNVSGCDPVLPVKARLNVTLAKSYTMPAGSTAD